MIGHPDTSLPLPLVCSQTSPSHPPHPGGRSDTLEVRAKVGRVGGVAAEQRGDTSERTTRQKKRKRERKRKDKV